MKYYKILTILLFGVVMSFYSCGDDSKTQKEETTTSTEASNPVTPQNTVTTNPANVEPPQNEKGVWHYTCSKGCPGGAGAATSCENCGGVLAHNTTYHAKPGDTNAATSSSPFANPATSTTSPTSKPTPEPSQNSAGVWHYTCGKGCAGGAGSAVNCSTCGDKLAHNKAYH